MATGSPTVKEVLRIHVARALDMHMSDKPRMVQTITRLQPLSKQTTSVDRLQLNEIQKATRSHQQHGKVFGLESNSDLQGTTSNNLTSVLRR